METIIDSNIYKLPQINQGTLNLCDAVGIAKYIELLIFRQTGKVVDISRRWIYINCAPIGVNGLKSEDVLKFGMTTGFCTTDLIDDNTSVTEEEYRNLTITPEMASCAAQYKIGSYIPVNPDPQSIQQVILNYSAVISSIPVGTITQQAILPPTEGNGIGLHLALLYGIGGFGDDFMIYWDNSYGSFWGNGGYGTFLWSQFAGKITQLFTITKLIISPMNSKSFQDSVENTLGYEGGLTNDPNDPGGLTNFGISKSSYPDVDVANLTKEQAIAIYFKDYWKPIYGDQMPECLSMNVFDCAVNCGVGTAIRMMQNVLGVFVDGNIGKHTLAAMALATPASAEMFASYRLAYYKTLHNFSLYEQSWIDRTNGTLAKSLAL